MHWVSAVVTVLGFAKELLKYMRQRGECKATAVSGMKGMTKALKKARKDGDTSGLEQSFNDLGIFGGGKLPDSRTVDAKDLQNK